MAAGVNASGRRMEPVRAPSRNERRMAACMRIPDPECFTMALPWRPKSP